MVSDNSNNAAEPVVKPKKPDPIRARKSISDDEMDGFGIESLNSIIANDPPLSVSKTRE